jgi:glyceraldehyde 3-phosphate dehydrogenase
MVKVGINGFGRIGRLVYRASLEIDDIEVVAINDLMTADTLAFLLKYDTVHGTLSHDIHADGDALIVDGKHVSVFNKKSPKEIPWGTLDVEVVIESSGIFRTKELASMHLHDSVKKVLVSAPMNDADITILPNINIDKYDPDKHHIISMASCTTNALAPLIKVLQDNYGILKGEMTTIHAYTNDQRLLDAIHRDIRRARAAAINLIPTSTGAAKAIFQIYPELQGKLKAISIRAPVPDVSLVDVSVVINDDTSRDEVNERFKEAAQTYLNGTLSYIEEPLVSSDFIGSKYLSIVDGLLTEVIDRDFVKVLAWYDNEMGYSYHLTKLASSLF